MPAPIPSIPRIRCAFAIILILIGFMLLGLTRRAFADETLDAPTVGGYALDYCLSWATDCGLPAADVYCKSKGYAGAVDFSSAPNSPPTMTLADSRVCDMASCSRITQIVCSVNTGGGGGTGGGGDDPCAQQRSALQIECKSLGYIIDQSTCQGHCNTDGQLCTDERAALEQQCGGSDKYSFEAYTCEGSCLGGTDTDGDGKKDDIDKDDDNDGIPDEDDACRTNPDPACTNPCEGTTDPNCRDTDGDGIKNSEDNDDDGDGILDSEDIDDDGDGILDKDETDTDRDGTPDEDDTDDDGDGEPDITDTDDDGDGVPDDEEISPYQPKEGAYTYTPAPETGDIGKQFKDRFTQFIDEMKATSVFSIPGQIFSNVPSGGSSTFTFNAGETFGQQEFSMESWVPGLAVLRGIFYIVAAWSAVKIALLGV